MPKYNRERRRLQVSTVYLFDGSFGCSCFVLSHMTCKKCKYEFCWVCMGTVFCCGWFCTVADRVVCLYSGPWSEHGTAWYSCNRFDEKESVEARDAQSKSRASLERYLHVSGARSSDSVEVYPDLFPRSITTDGLTTSNQPSYRWTCTPRPRRKWKRCNLRPL